jgi:DNA-binding beta-propeller fold protein YncE
MLAVIYLGLAICVGERLCSYFFRFISTAHRWATGTLVGLLLSACFTYQAGRHFASASNPLLWGDGIFFATAAIFLINCPSKRNVLPLETRTGRSAASDWITLGLFSILVCWMMFATLNFREGRVEIGLNQWSDYGPNTAIVQNFAFGKNFPAEYPHYAHEPIKYHFLFYFTAGNLEFLGLNLAWAENAVSIITMLSLLALIMAFGELLFKSRAVGIVAAVFFFLHGNLNLVPFIQRETQGHYFSWEAIKKAASAIYHLGAYLSSGYPYRGEDWGIWTQVVYINQRHLASSIGIFLVVLIFLFDRYIEKARERQLARAAVRAKRRTPPPPVTHSSFTAPPPPRTDSSPWTSNPSATETASTPHETSPSEPGAPPVQMAGTGEAEPPSVAESSSIANAAASEHTSPATIVQEEPTRPLPEGRPVIEEQQWQRVESAEGGSSSTTSLPILDETNAATPPAHEHPAPIPERVSEPEPTKPIDSLNQSTQPEHPTRWNVDQGADGLKNEEQTIPAPEHSLVGDTEAPRLINSEGETAQVAEGGLASEQPSTFATRAYDEYMGVEPASSAPIKKDTEEAEALAFARESFREPEPVLDEKPAEVAVAMPSRGFAIDLFYDTVVNGRAFIFCGLLLGCLPYWNAPVFTAAAAVLGVLFVLFPYRRYMVALAITAGVIAIPQILTLRAGNARSGASLIHWGYTLGPVPVTQVLKYIWWTFGLKWILIGLSLLFFSWRNIRLFVAMFSLYLLTFCLQFSDENLANHKFLNIWLVLANLFAAYGLWRLWRLVKGWWGIPFRAVAVALVFPIVLGGVIDFFPIHNLSFIETNYTKDRLIDWLRAETKPDAVFLSDKFVNHPILLAGRKIFFGYTYFTWGAGYDIAKREIAYKLMFESKNAHQVFTLLKANGIDYVAYDDGVRGAFKNNNEQLVYAPNFRKVFEGSDYWNLALYKVPENADFVPASSGTPVPGATTVGASVFDGGKGKENGQFDFPRGLAVDSAGNIWIADTNNSRLQKFAPNGGFLSVIGKPGTGPGEFQQPGGIAIDSAGNLYVADVSNHRVQKLSSTGKYLADWKGPDMGFYGPRDIFIGPDDSLYVVDEGHGRIVKMDLDGNPLLVWGTTGAGDGQFGDVTSVAVDPKTNKIYVADPGNRRIQVFDSYGKFLAKWTVEEWRPVGWSFQDLVIDSDADRLYASSVGTDEVLVFDLSGKKITSLRPNPPDHLEGCSSLALTKGRLYALNTYGNRLSWIDLPAK